MDLRSSSSKQVFWLSSDPAAIDLGGHLGKQVPLARARLVGMETLRVQMLFLWVLAYSGQSVSSPLLCAVIFLLRVLCVAEAQMASSCRYCTPRSSQSTNKGRARQQLDRNEQGQMKHGSEIQSGHCTFLLPETRGGFPASTPGDTQLPAL